jgi:CheY-like chemotaxis protein
MARPRVILLIEDDEDDVEILCDAFETVSKDYKIIHAQNGEEGLEVLHNLVQGNKTPCLIILDVNMPKMDGKEVIAALRRKQSYEQIPVVVFTTSKQPADKEYFHQHGAEMLTKPSSFTDFLEIAKHLLGLC